MPNLVEFERAQRPNRNVEPVEGEDGEVIAQEGQEAPPVRLLMVNPLFVSMFFETQTPGISVIKGPDGRGFLVVGTFEQVKAKLEMGGHEQRPTDESVN